MNVVDSKEMFSNIRLYGFSTSYVLSIGLKTLIICIKSGNYIYSFTRVYSKKLITKQIVIKELKDLWFRGGDVYKLDQNWFFDIYCNNSNKKFSGQLVHIVQTLDLTDDISKISTIYNTITIYEYESK